MCETVPGCTSDPTADGSYHARNKICRFHSQAEVLLVNGLHQRWCQQCHMLHLLAEFDGGRRSCRISLAAHRKRSRLVAEGSASITTFGRPTQSTRTSSTRSPAAAAAASSTSTDVAAGISFNSELARTSSCLSPLPVAGGHDAAVLGGQSGVELLLQQQHLPKQNHQQQQQQLVQSQPPQLPVCADSGAAAVVPRLCFGARPGGGSSSSGSNGSSKSSEKSEQSVLQASLPQQQPLNQPPPQQQQQQVSQEEKKRQLFELLRSALQTHQQQEQLKQQQPQQQVSLGVPPNQANLPLLQLSPSAASVPAAPATPAAAAAAAPPAVSSSCTTSAQAVDMWAKLEKGELPPPCDRFDDEFQDFLLEMELA